MAGKRNRGVPFGSVVVDISRGIQLTAEQLQSCLTDEETGYRYLSLADLKDDSSFQIDFSELRFFDPSRLDRDVSRFCIKPNMLLLSKNDTPFKVQIAGDMNDEKIIAAGNIYMITADEEKVIPRWLCYWLQSDEGMARLRSAAAMTARNRMRWLSIKQLQGVMIPKINFREQADYLITKLNDYTSWITKITQEFKKNSEEIMGIFKSLGLYEDCLNIRSDNKTEKLQDSGES